jgi:hypothetical protein
MFGYRTGAKQEHVNQIRAMSESGMTAEQISRQLMIDLACVKSFVQRFQSQREKATPKVKEAEQVSEELADSEEDKPTKKRGVGRPPRQSKPDDNDAEID